ncbi:hypothetical protein AB0H88_46370 [Nonomuraea sp. NPDC050680]|uniref:hypothetical protein n=1 Tax=Nonomuraea sp. NPDC050680 TaxID=3154630 RepID=UPI0033FBB4A1
MVVTLSAAVFAAGGFATAKADPGGPGAGSTPTPVASPSEPPVTFTETPPTPTPDPSDTPSTPPPLGPIPKITSKDPIPMPLDPVMTSLSDIDLIDTASELKARDCMRTLGFTTWTTDAMSGPKDDEDSDLLDYLPLADATQSGYPTVLSEKAPDLGSSSESAPSADAVRAYAGAETTTASGAAVPAGGCLSEGERQLKGNAPELPIDPRFLAVEAKFSALRDDRMQPVLATWSSCMASRGFHYDNPVSAHLDPRWAQRAADTPAGAEEKAAAAADAACQAETNLVGTYKALEIAYQKQVLDQNQAQLTTALSIFNTWVSNAKSIIAAH